MVDLLQQAAPGSTVIVFGSCARGDPKEDSDLDVLVVEPEVNDRLVERVSVLFRSTPCGLDHDWMV